MRSRAAPACRVLLAAILPAVAACSTGRPPLSCTAGEPRALPESLPESSGVVWSARDAALFWTMNDGSDGTLHAVDTTGALVGRVETTGPRLRDVEDLSGGPCDQGYCLYLADTGDNEERRETVSIYRLAEPAPDAGSVGRTRHPVRFPDGPRDVEAMFVLPGERIHLVTKGREHPPTIYRYPGPLLEDSVVTLEAVAALGDRPASFSGRITGASRAPGSSELVLVRSYESMMVYRVGEGGVESVGQGVLNLRSLQEAQGEAVGANDDGRVILTSEAGPLAPRATFRILRCTLDPALAPAE